MSRRLVLMSSLALSLWCALMWWLVKQSTPVAPMVDQFTRNAAAAAFLGAGLMQGVNWRRNREPHLLWTALALMVIGLKFPLGTALGLGPWQADSPVEPALIVRLVLVFTVILLAILALTGNMRPVWPQSRLRRRLLLGCGATVAGLLMWGSVGGNASSALDSLRAAEWLATASWAALSAVFLLCSRPLPRPTRYWGSVALALMALVELAHALDLAGPIQLIRYSAGVQLLVSLLSFRAVLARFRTDSTSSEVVNRELSGHLWTARRDLYLSSQRENERLHDARTAIFSLIAASELLADEDLTQGQRDRSPLTGLMSSELKRLSGLLEIAGDEPIESFSLTDALQPLVFAAHLSGLNVRLHVADCWALGRESAITSAVANVLANSRTHAPGCMVTVDIRRSGTNVVVRVADDGPGIPAAERYGLLERGVRGSTSLGPGSGIGLYTAAKAMARDGGSLELSETAGGGTTVRLALPASDNPVPDHVPVDRLFVDLPQVSIRSAGAMSGG